MTDKFKQALEKILSIPNKPYGGDWDEIEEARAIAKAALTPSRKTNKAPEQSPLLTNPSHNWKYEGCHLHNGEYWYECTECGKRASYGDPKELSSECPGKKPTRK